MYFVIAYDLWPHLTGKALESIRLMRIQLWLWFVGMIVVTFPWHYVGILSIPRRMAYFDYSDPAIAPQAVSVVITFLGGLLLVVSAILFIVILLRGHLSSRIELPEFRFSMPVHQPKTVPIALNSFALWLTLMIALTVVNYGYPIAKLIGMKETSVPAIPVGVKR
jgi:cytochrome c oxidase subunit 1